MTAEQRPGSSGPLVLWRTVLVPCAFLFVSMLNLTLIVAGLKDLMIDQLGGSEEHVSLFFSIEMAAYIVFAPLWGLLSDRLGMRRPLIALGFLMSAVIYASYSTIESIPMMLGLRFVQGAFSVMGWSILMAMVLDQPNERKRGRYMGLMGAALILGVSIGAPLGGYITRSYGAYAPLQLTAVLFFLLGLGTVFLSGAGEKRPQVSISEITTALYARPRLLLPSLFYFVDRYSVSFIVVLFPLYLETLGESDPAIKGQLLGYFLLPFAFLQYPFGRLTERIGTWRPLVGGSLLYGVALCTVGYSGLFALPWVMFLLGVLAAVMFPPAITLTAELSEPSTRGSAMGGFNLAGSLGFAIGPLVSVWAFKAYGFGFAFMLAGSLEIAAAVIGGIVILMWSRAGKPLEEPVGKGVMVEP
ncbi:MAG: MFS transporter [bacterium]|nr:MFS transporter [bacterium]